VVCGVRFTTLLPGRADDKPVAVLAARTAVLDAAPEGAVRAMTERFCTEEGGVAPALRFAAPKELWRAGEKDERLLTSAPRREASVTWAAPRLIDCPPTKALREATVTAPALCA
jgi:hypothetical protein